MGQSRFPTANACCKCCSLKAGTITTGILGVVLSLTTLIIVLTTKLKIRTFLIDSLPVDVVKIILAINLIMTILISILLIIGAVRRNMYMMLPWVILGFMLIFGLIISVIYTAVDFFSHKNNLEGSLWLVFGFVAVIVYSYLWWVVFSFYLQIKDEHGRGPYGKTPYPLSA